MSRTIVREWWEHHTNLAMLFRYLVDEDKLDPTQVDEVEYFLEKPYKWADEWAALTARSSDGH